MSQDERPGEERGQEELIAAFAALGGPLTDAEFLRLLGSDEYCGRMVRLAALLLDGDTAAAHAVVRDSLAAAQAARGRLGDREQARVYMCRAVVDRSRSVHWHRAAQSHDAPHAAPRVPGATHAGIGYRDQDPDPQISALRALPYRQREAVVLRHHMGLSERQTAQAMSISIGAARSHLAHGMSLLERPPRQ
jgi:DNA-directed RNA polymerase specialized sigma24 family protein